MCMTLQIWSVGLRTEHSLLLGSADVNDTNTTVEDTDVLRALGCQLLCLITILQA